MSANQQQSEAWNGSESVHWMNHADRWDRQLAPFTEALLERVGLEPHDTVIDIGCGCGATTLAAARRARTVLGVDLSEPLVGVAIDRARAASVDNVEFLVADAQTHPFAECAFGVAISQFGLMFFDDPVSALVNLRGAVVPSWSLRVRLLAGTRGQRMGFGRGRRGHPKRRAARARRTSPWTGHVRVQGAERDHGGPRRRRVYRHPDRFDRAVHPRRRGRDTRGVDRISARYRDRPRAARPRRRRNPRRDDRRRARGTCGPLRAGSSASGSDPAPGW